jgi:hypothetical protein
MSEPEALRSVHTTSFPQILNDLSASLLVTTYQSGKLVIVRADGEQLNTHFRAMEKPMGLALDGGWLAVGTARQIIEQPIPRPDQRRRRHHRHDVRLAGRGVATGSRVSDEVNGPRRPAGSVEE